MSNVYNKVLILVPIYANVLIAGGITTITTVYKAMGKAIAQMVETGKNEVIENPIILTAGNLFNQ
jgi:hypothetical protein